MAYEFKQLERTPSYKRMEKFIQKILEEQWNDFLLSGAVNTLYLRYKEFFVNRRGKKITIRKGFMKQEEWEEEENEIRSIQDLKARERATQQQDRFVVGEDVLKVGALMLFLRTLTTKNVKSVGGYYGFRREMEKYLKEMANKGGQSVVSLIPTKKPVTFRLTDSMYKNKIKDRVSELVKSLDETSKKRLVNALFKGIKTGEKKADLIKRVQKEGIISSKSRAKIIVGTETEAVAEWMRLETARINGFRSKTWIAVADEKLCFPKFTQVLTDKGNKNIQSIRIGDKVLTRKGYNKVIAVSKREYEGQMTILKTLKGILISTGNHPIWKKDWGWLEARYLERGDFIQTLHNKDMRILSRNNFFFKNSNDMPPMFFKKIILSSVFFFVRMPIFAVCFQGNSQINQQEINTISSNRGFLNIFNFKFIERLSNHFFQRRFSRKFSIARKATKSSDSLGGRAYSKFLKTCFTDIKNRGAVTFFRTVNLSSFISSKLFFAGRANYNPHIFPSTFKTTDHIPMGNFARDSKNLRTCRANFIHSFGLTILVIAFFATKFFFSIYTSLIFINRFFTLKANDLFSSFARLMIAISRAVSMPASKLPFFLKDFITFIASIFKHYNQLLTYFLILYNRWEGKTIVYDIQVELQSEFYANGILVHNCDICRPLDGQSIPINRNFKSDVGDIEGPPAHTSCRCNLEYGYEQDACSNYIKSHTNSLENIDALFRKAKGYEFYDKGDVASGKCVNTNAVWDGGKVVGQDKNISEWKDALDKYEGSKLMEDRIIEDSKQNLSAEGVVQLRLSLGRKGLINNNS